MELSANENFTDTSVGTYTKIYNEANGQVNNFAKVRVFEDGTIGDWFAVVTIKQGNKSRVTTELTILDPVIVHEIKKGLSFNDELYLHKMAKNYWSLIC